jgi:alpha-glucosidase
MKKLFFAWITLLAMPALGYAQKMTVESPNGKIGAGLYCRQQGDQGEWYLDVTYLDSGRRTVIIPSIALGLTRSDQQFGDRLRFLRAGKPVPVVDDYTALHGKRSHCVNRANERVVQFVNPGGAAMNVIIRAYDDGVVFRYVFPEKEGTYTINDELTAYTIPSADRRWLEKWNTANEGLYTMSGGDSVQHDWCYPALFRSADPGCWYLIHESDVSRSYCGTKLSNTGDRSVYKLTFPDAKDGRGQGASAPVIHLPWQSPWRVIIIGGLSDLVASTLVDDVAKPSVVQHTEWVKPGIVSWNYWSNNHGTRDYKIVCDFADLAARMGWRYTLLDWEWDAMGNGGNLEDAIRYILSRGITPLMWYNSGGKHTWVSATPKDRMLTHASRMEEFAKLKKLGVAGVKVDFFESEKQDMISYYLDILEDAAASGMMVYFHGCLVPRGWSRTYPNLMTHEAVRGAEWYNNGPEFTMTAPVHNCILPFTRNVVGPMDYTPVTFTNSQYPHSTSYGHELALSIVFESGLQHMADRPEGYDGLPEGAKSFLREVPAAWDDTRLLEGYPGQDVVMARRKGDKWFVGGISGENREKEKRIVCSFLSPGVRYRVSLTTDGVHDKSLNTQYVIVDRSGKVDVKLLRRGGFVAFFEPL